MKNGLRRKGRFAASFLAVALAIGASDAHLEAQTETLALNARTAEERGGTGEKNALERGRFAVLIDLDENRLYFKEGDVTLWSAPVGTGTGMRVITNDDDWDFSTPTGRFQVQYKERDPVWIAPDWYFVENNLPVPPKNHPSRYLRGTLGAAAIYISPNLAIHGTNRPELIGQRVSHGCIRLENRYAMRLYHNMQVGTEVIIVGGDEILENRRVVDLRRGYDASLASSGSRPTLPVDAVYEGWKKLDTEDLLAVLDRQLSASERISRWDEVAILLLNRSRSGDDEALVGLLSRAGALPSAKIEREWATFLAEAYRRTTVRALEAMSRLPLRQRRHAADLIVSAMLTLHPGEMDAPAAPWPTTRIPEQLVTRTATRGWDALTTAEREHRNRLLAVNSGEVAGEARRPPTRPRSRSTE